MSAERIAGLTALVSGTLLVVAIVVSALAGYAAPFGPGADATRRIGMMRGGEHMGPGMMGGGHMMGFGASGPAATAIPGAPEVRVQAENFRFVPSEIRLSKSGDVNLTLTNPTAVVHDLTVPGLGIHLDAGPGATRTIGLRGLPAGRYDAFCSVPGHAELGMRGTVLVE